MKTDFKTILFYTLLSTFSVLLFWFTALVTIDYSKNLIQGYTISIGVVLFYLFILYQSHLFFQKNRVGLAYFLLIGFFFILAFIQMVGCSGSTVWMH